MDKKVLITGASGFVGSCLVRRLLKENYKIHIITRDSTNLWRLRDILKDIENHNVEDVINTNVIGTFNLFREFSKKGIGMFVNTSSSSEYGEKLKPMSEDMSLAPNNMYGASKVAGTTLCTTYAKTNKIPLVTLRLF